MKVQIVDAASIAEQEVKNEFIKEFRSIYAGNIIPSAFDEKFKITITKLSKPIDIDNILSGAGFYIIVTDLEVAGNKCELTYLDTLKAIYRGECGTVKKRIQSHLFNSIYKMEYEKRKSDYLAKAENNGKEFHEQFWPACLKVGNGNSGLNIDKEYKDKQWYVITHNMIGSSQQVRVQAELAFDVTFNKPAASRENT